MRDMHATPEAERWDALVVGAGPAGMLAALALGVDGARTLLVDAGPDAHERRRVPLGGLRDDDGGADYESGIGGAGLFSDGKLCLSLDVGGHLEESLDADERADLLAELTSVFESLLDGAARPAEPSELDRLSADAGAVGLRFKYYPVLHVGTDRCRDVILRLRDLLATAGVEIRAHTTLVRLDVEPESRDKLALVRHPDGSEGIVRAANVVLALGKVGAARQSELCSRLGIALETQPFYAGVRFETSAETLAPLFSVTKDPKYSLTFDDGTKIKTHCASENGEVIALRYEGLPLAGGHNYSDERTGRSGFSLLWDGFETGPDAYATALGLMRRANSLSQGSLLAQRVLDYERGRPSHPAELEALPLSCRDVAAGDVRDVLPAEYFRRVDLFLDRLERLVPRLRDDEAVFYAPAIEWWMKRVAVDEHMATSVPGLYACGDGSGWSQGIVHAAATGLLAATGILGGRPKLADWVESRSSRAPALATAAV
jgi:uncharacterized protein